MNGIAASRMSHIARSAISNRGKNLIATERYHLPRSTAAGVSSRQHAPGQRGRAAAMTDPRLLVLAELGEGPPERRVVEERIVAEAARAARCVEDHALGDGPDHGLVSGAVDDRDHAAEASAAAHLRHVTQCGQQPRAAAGVVEAGAAVA